VAPPVTSTPADAGPPWALIGAGVGAAVVVTAAVVGGVAFAVASNQPPAAITVSIE
jgi:hypothetical protein